MGTINVTDLAAHYRQWTNQAVTFTAHDSFIAMETPFVDMFHDIITLVIEKTDDGYRVSDDGYFFDELDIDQWKSGTRTRLQRALALSGVKKTDNRELVVDFAALEDFPRAQNTLVQALILVAGLGSMMVQEPVINEPRKPIMDINQVAGWYRLVSFSNVRSNSAAENITLVKLMNLLYFSQGVNLAETGQPLFDDRMEAWQYGAFISSIYDRFDGQHEVAIKIGDEEAQANYRDVEANRQASRTVNSVQQAFGDKSASDLMAMIRGQKPWKRAKHKRLIDEKALGQYFSDHVMKHDDDD